MGELFSFQSLAYPNTAGPLVDGQVDLVVSPGVVLSFPHAVVTPLAGNEVESFARLEATAAADQRHPHAHAVRQNKDHRARSGVQVAAETTRSRQLHFDTAGAAVEVEISDVRAG